MREDIHHLKPLRYQRTLGLPLRWMFNTVDLVDDLMDGVGFVQEFD